MEVYHLQSEIFGDLLLRLELTPALESTRFGVMRRRLRRVLWCVPALAVAALYLSAQAGLTGVWVLRAERIQAEGPNPTKLP